MSPHQDALVNLTGRSVFNLWTETYKKGIYDSRILTTRHLVDALPADTKAVLLSTSAAGFYGDGGETKRPRPIAAATISSPTSAVTGRRRRPRPRTRAHGCR